MAWWWEYTMEDHGLEQGIGHCDHVTIRNVYIQCGGMSGNDIYVLFNTDGKSFWTCVLLFSVNINLSKLCWSKYFHNVQPKHLKDLILRSVYYRWMIPIKLYNVFSFVWLRCWVFIYDSYVPLLVSDTNCENELSPPDAYVGNGY